MGKKKFHLVSYFFLLKSDIINFLFRTSVPSTYTWTWVSYATYTSSLSYSRSNVSRQTTTYSTLSIDTKSSIFVWLSSDVLPAQPMVLCIRVDNHPFNITNSIHRHKIICIFMVSYPFPVPIPAALNLWYYKSGEKPTLWYN